MNPADQHRMKQRPLAIRRRFREELARMARAALDPASVAAACEGDLPLPFTIHADHLERELLLRRFASRYAALDEVEHALETLEACPREEGMPRAVAMRGDRDDEDCVAVVA